MLHWVWPQAWSLALIKLLPYTWCVILTYCSRYNSSPSDLFGFVSFILLPFQIPITHPVPNIFGCCLTRWTFVMLTFLWELPTEILIVCNTYLWEYQWSNAVLASAQGVDSLQFAARHSDVLPTTLNLHSMLWMRLPAFVPLSKRFCAQILSSYSLVLSYS